MKRQHRAPMAALLAAFTLAGCSSSDDDVGNAPSLQVRSLSARPDFVSGGDALVRVDLPAGVAANRVKVFANGADVTSAFRPDAAGNGLVGLVTGLRSGDNAIVARHEDAQAAREGTLTVKNAPITGPLLSGPQQQPFVCQTTEFALPDGTRLPAAQDANCSVPTVVQYVYRVTGAPAATAFRPLANPQALPADAATTTTIDGRAVPFVVRVETGTINRAIYQVSMLHDPSREAAPSFALQPAGWNGRLVYTFGGGCTGGWFRQGATTGGVLDENILKQGYAMASSSLNVFGNNCQDLTAAETMAMVKERFIEAYGPPRYTIGWGCSGGSYQQHQIADNYPGLLDGILPGCSFPEVLFATVYSITDARLLGNYFDNLAPNTFTPQQQQAVAGFLNLATLRTSTVYEGALRISPTRYCPPVLPAAQRYDATTNPGGARCDVYTHTINALGTDPATGLARRPLDNVGVQYGLAALNAGTITVDQFLDMNERIGGYDRDAGFQAARTVADPIAMRNAYQTGRLTNGGGGLKDVPIIDYRNYTDDNPIGDIHLRYHSFSMRERLRKANGTADNQVMLVEGAFAQYGYYSSQSPLLLRALSEMDKWLAAIAADASDAPKSVKVIRNKPPTLQEGCNTRDANPTFIAEQMVRGQGRCEALYPSSPPPREVAGAPVAHDIIKCQLKPVSLADYRVPFSAPQQARLAQVFPAGVCDWSRPGAEQQGLRGTWLTF